MIKGIVTAMYANPFNMFFNPSGQNVSLDSAYHSLNRTILFQLSRPLARLTGEQ